MANKKKNSDKAIYRLYMDFRGGEITGMFLNELKALRKNRLDSCVLISFFKKFLLF